MKWFSNDVEKFTDDIKNLVALIMYMYGVL